MGDRNVIRIAFASTMRTAPRIWAIYLSKRRPADSRTAHAISFARQAEVEESDIYLWMSGGPQAEAFNAFIAKIYALDRWNMDEKGASDR